MKVRSLILALAALLAAGPLSTASAQQSHGPVHITSVAHAVSPPAKSSGADTSKKIFGPARVIPLRRPEDTGLATNGGGGEAGPAAPSVGNWSDADVQTTYSPSQLTVGNVFSGIGFTAKIPPDENLSVGINTTGANPQTQIVLTVNTSYTVYSTSGSGIKGGYLSSSFFGGLTNSLCSTTDGGDPIVLFDKLDGRWIISQLAYDSAFTDNHLCLAISQTSDATGAYDAYDFSFGSNLPDYPKLAVWPDGIYFSANIYNSNGAVLQFTGGQACSFPRSNVANPPPSGHITFSCSPANDAGIYNILPADLENPPGTASLPSGPDYYMQYVDNLSPSSGNILRLYQFDPNAGSLNIVNNLTVNDFHDACGGGTCIPQYGTAQQLDSLGDRLMYRLSFRSYGDHDQMVANHSVQIDSSDNQTGIRWYVVRRDQGGAFYVNKESTFSPDVSTYRWMGSIAQNSNGDLGLGYSTSGVTSVPGISVTGLKNGTDALMELGQRMYNGSDQSYQGTYSRWGDYSSVSVDPSDDCSFWYTNEYVKPPVLSFDFLWQTVVGKFSFGTCSGSTPSSFALSANAPTTQTVAAGTVGTTYSITVTPASGYNGVVDLSVGSTCPSGATCSLSPSQIDFGSSSAPATTSLTVDTSTGTAAQNYNIVVKGTDHSTPSITSQTSVLLAVTDFSLSSNPTSQTVTGGTDATYTITANALDGFAGTVNLSVGTTCPSGLTCTFGSTSISAGSSTNLTVSGTDSITTSSTFTITVTGTSGGLTHTTNASLTVNPPPPDFSVSATPGSQTVTPGTAATYTVNITPSGGFSGSVTFNASGFPSGVTVGFSPNPATSASTMNVATDASTAPGTYTLTVTGTSGALTHTTTVSLTVSSQPDFSLSASPSSQTVTAGSNTSYTVTITPSGGFSAGVNLSVNGLPTGATPSFSQNPATSSSTLNITTSGSTPTGTSTLTITGISGSLTHSTTVSLTVSSQPDFSLSASPPSQTVTQGSGTNFGVTITATGGFSGSVGFSVSGLPSGAGASFTPNPATSSSTMAVTTNSSTPTGTYPLTITGSSGSLSHTTNVSLTVNAPTNPDFTLGADSTTINVAVNSSSMDTITLTPSGGFTGSVSLSLSGLPRRTSSSFSVNPLSITGSSPGSSVLTISTNRNTSTGSYPLVLTATGGGVTQTLPLTLIVGSTSSPDFSISALPSSQTVDPTSSTSFTVSVASSGGFSGSVGLTANGLPSGASASFNPTSISGSGSSTLTINTSSTPLGTYTLTITGTSGSLIHSTMVTLVVGTAAGGDFSLSASPGSVTLHGGGTATYTISVTPASGANPTVGFHVTGLPNGASASFAPPSTTGSGSTTLSVIVPSGVTGNSTLTITGTNTEGTSHAVSVGLKLH
jgi:uncharacterized membrane protein